MRARRHLGVRGRVQLSFALGGLLVSVFVAAVSWSLTTTYLYNQREITATREALLSVDVLRRSGPGAEPPTVERLQQVVPPGGRAVFIGSDGTGVSTTPLVLPTEIPDELVELAREGAPAQQRLQVGDRVLQAVAVPLPELNGVYVGLFRLEALDEVLQVLSLVLVATAALATLLAAGVGRWATQRTLRPLRVVNDAAAAVAAGSLEARVDARGDPDLEPLAAAFNQTVTQLRARMERDARFASDVSHELRSPVTTIANAAEVLNNRRHELSGPGREVLALLCEEVERFRSLINDLLEISKDDQLAAVPLQPIVLGELVQRVADHEAGRPVTRVDERARRALVAGDHRRLQQAVANLVVNAQVHGDGVREVAVQRVGDHVQVRVSDHGQGVPEEWRHRVFERFARAPSARATTDGSGLGLALVAQHVRRHGGDVWVEDGVPGGACFVVELPVLEDA